MVDADDPADQPESKDSNPDAQWERSRNLGRGGNGDEVRPSSSNASGLAQGGGRAGGSTVGRKAEGDRSRRARKPTPCKFWGTRNGCRAGDSCQYLHDPSYAAAASGQDEPLRGENDGRSEQRTTDTSPAPDVAKQHRQSRLKVTVDPKNVATRPVSKAESGNPREFQLQQIRRRFSPTEISSADGTALGIKLKPSDPDFPFEMEFLDCVLHVPHGFPGTGVPSIQVKNKEMGRGYQINVERGFDELVRSAPRSTLLGLMNTLDRRLESLLTGEKAETIKLVANRKPPSPPVSASASEKVAEKDSQQIGHARPAEPVFSRSDLAIAHERRVTETRQLVARLGRLPLFSADTDGLAYTVPVEPRRRADVPVPLQNVKATRLFVPRLYPLQPCRILLQGVSRDAAAATEQAFEDRAKKAPATSLLGHINNLALNMHIYATEGAAEYEQEGEREKSPEPGSQQLPSKTQNAVTDAERPHVHVIQRPLEWGLPFDSNMSDDSEFTDTDDEPYSGDDGEPIADATALATVPAAESSGPERGVSIDFPNLELHGGIELLELSAPKFSVKCLRCKELSDIGPVKTGVPRVEVCKKCASDLTVGYRKELMHRNSARAGFLDLDGCTVMDLLPSHFLPTCSECSTTAPPPGIVAVRGDSATTVCRECHRRMSFKIPEIKFLLVSASATAAANRGPPRRKPRKENLGIVAGQQLPHRGRCTHYARSYRWFRFSCCGKVYACDRCHDLGEKDHPNEHGNRMICGFCSREQNYRPEDCGFCHATLVKKSGSGFWEGGKGTRDRVRMNRNDPRKHKRVGGSRSAATAATAAAAAKKKA